jgi:hypothetical protein
MDVFLLIVFLLVALIAYVVPLRLEQMGVLGRVGVVTEGAFPHFQGNMDARLIHRDLVFGMTAKADLIPLLLEKQLGNDAVPEVAIFTFLFFDHRVHIFQGEILVGKFFVAVHALFLGELLCRKGRVIPKEKDNAAQGQEYP